MAERNVQERLVPVACQRIYLPVQEMWTRWVYIPNRFRRGLYQWQQRGLCEFQVLLRRHIRPRMWQQDLLETESGGRSFRKRRECLSQTSSCKQVLQPAVQQPHRHDLYGYPRPSAAASAQSAAGMRIHKYLDRNLYRPPDCVPPRDRPGTVPNHNQAPQKDEWPDQKDALTGCTTLGWMGPAFHGH